MEEKKWAVHISGGQVNIAKGQGTIYATQNNGVSAGELGEIIRKIKEDLPALEREDADKISDIVDMVKEEIGRPEPRAGRLRNCVTLIAPMITIANGLPNLANNLQRLMDYVTQYIHA